MITNILNIPEIKAKVQGRRENKKLCAIAPLR